MKQIYGIKSFSTKNIDIKPAGCTLIDVEITINKEIFLFLRQVSILLTDVFRKQSSYDG